MGGSVWPGTGRSPRGWGGAGGKGRRTSQGTSPRVSRHPTPPLTGHGQAEFHSWRIMYAMGLAKTHTGKASRKKNVPRHQLPPSYRAPHQLLPSPATVTRNPSTLGPSCAAGG